ncbi:MAG: sigma-70 family RNA polymerase sigma factor [Myxococcales bacterium]|nr:sigma-70 family RNA polymerase sigma factor [Myxococcales bacterium]
MGHPPDEPPTITERLRAARARWPDVSVDDDHFARYLAARAGDDLSIDALNTDDLYLACACAAGDDAALRTFERELLPTIDGALRRMSLAPSIADDVKQSLRTQLFVAAAGDEPGITKYSGRGDLRGWLRVTAVRAALKALRPYRRAPDFDDDELLLEVADDQTDPELAHVKRVYRGQLKHAVAAACAKLSARERNLLRLSTIDQLSIDQIGELYRVHRATSARWLNRARERLVVLTRELLEAQLRLSRTEQQHVVALVRSQLDLSLPRVLSAGDKDEPSAGE